MSRDYFGRRSLLLRHNDDVVEVTSVACCHGDDGEPWQEFPCDGVCDIFY